MEIISSLRLMVKVKNLAWLKLQSYEENIVAALMGGDSRPVFPTILMLWQFDTVPHAAATSNHKIVSLLLHGMLPLFWIVVYISDIQDGLGQPLWKGHLIP